MTRGGRRCRGRGKVERGRGRRRQRGGKEKREERRNDGGDEKGEGRRRERWRGEEGWLFICVYIASLKVLTKLTFPYVSCCVTMTSILFLSLASLRSQMSLTSALTSSARWMSSDALRRTMSHDQF